MDNEIKYEVQSSEQLQVITPVQGSSIDEMPTIVQDISDMILAFSKNRKDRLDQYIDTLVEEKAISQATRDFLGTDILGSIAYSIQHARETSNSDSEEAVEPHALLKHFISVYNKHFEVDTNNTEASKLPYYSFCVARSSLKGSPDMFARSRHQSKIRPRQNKDEIERDFKFRMAISYPRMDPHKPTFKSLTKTVTFVHCGEYMSLSFLTKWAEDHVLGTQDDTAKVAVTSYAYNKIQNVAQSFCANCQRYSMIQAMKTPGLRITDIAWTPELHTDIGFRSRGVYQSEITSKRFSDGVNEFITDEEMKELYAVWGQPEM
ncbi:hypothetical protein CPC08DRAFT_765875 [Agrocybe pediades]|nr:hypothetical protein CPC08DRAFT_765875 [Agrocybe pediades]